MSRSEKHWALKSSNLKRIKENGQKSVLSRNISRNSSINGSERPVVSSHHHHTDIRKSSYPILPNPPFFNKLENKNNLFITDKWEIESNNTSDYGSDTSVQRSPHLYELPNVIDNTFYHKHSNKNNQNIPFNQQNNERQSIPKQYVHKQHQRITRTSSKNRLNLNTFHALQLISFEIIDEALEDEIVPDVLIDVFKEIQFKEKLFYTELVPIVRSTTEQIMVEVIDQYIQETVLVSVLRDSKNQLQSQMILKWLLDDILPPHVVEVTKEAICGVANEKMIISRCNYFFEKLIAEVIQDEIKTSENIFFREVILEASLEEFVIDPLIVETLEIFGFNMIDYYHEKVSRINLQQVNEMAAEKPLFSLIMDHFISVGARQKSIYGTSFGGQYCFEYIVFDILLKKTFEIYDRLINTIDNQSLCRWHQNVNKSIATDILINELLEHSDADLCDLDANEIDESYIPRYLENISEMIYSKTK